MSPKERVYGVLLVSSSACFNSTAAELLSSSRYNPVRIAKSTVEAHQYADLRDFDFVIVNLPLSDETGIRFAIECSLAQTAAVLILASAEEYNNVYDKVTEYGIFTLKKPTSKAILLQALSWLASSREQLRKMEQHKSSLEERMEEIRIINRAKCVLISIAKMTEPEAHRYIEKSAMDKCIPKKEAAETIIRRYH